MYMKKLYLFIVLVAFPLLAMAQASGGQIRRPSQTHQNNQSNSQRRLLANKINNHEYVDLGLSVKWATCNIGASKPEEYGNYYAWGEVRTKQNYSWETYNDLVKTNINYDLTKDDYVLTKEYFHKYDRFSSTTFGKEDDAATISWGQSWRTPSIEDVIELWNLPHEWVTIKGVTGMKFTAPNGNSIFLPATGGIKLSSSFEKSETGYYWTRNLHDDDYDVSELAKVFGFDKEGGGLVRAKRYYGFAIRPVTK